MKDILLYISDQHAGQVQGYLGDSIVRTPCLDQIAAQGTAFSQAYTPHPVCVPARMSLLSGQYSSHCDVMDNHTALDSNTPTFVHSLNAAGYETVLCGRMHFVGPDQRHGYERRIAGDITQIYHNRPTRISAERGYHDHTLQGGPGALQYVGGGDSPSLAYDRYVVSKALSYLQGTYDRPQFLTVGTYAPHHPYVAPKELFEYYYDRVEVPEESFAYSEHPAYAETFRERDPKLIRAVRAAYWGMVEYEDQQIGQVYDAFQAYLTRNHREGLFIYISDHGEHAGYRGMYGKNTFYDCSTRIPMVFAGCGIRKGACLNGPVSLLDIGPTLCAYTKAPNLPRQEGKSLLSELFDGVEDLDRIILSETGGTIRINRFSYGQMARWKQYKFIHYHGFDSDDILYDLRQDPQESRNVITQHPEIATRLRSAISACLNPKVETLQRRAIERQQAVALLRRCSFDSEELWHCPPEARLLPDPLFGLK